MTPEIFLALSPLGVCVTTADFAFSATENQSLTLWKKAKNRVFTQTPLGERVAHAGAFFSRGGPGEGVSRHKQQTLWKTRVCAGWRRAQLCVSASNPVYHPCHACLQTPFRTRPASFQTPVAELRSAPAGSSPFFPNSFENSRNLGEKARGLLDLWVTFCFHFLTGGKAGNQIEQFDLDS